ncbi:MAG: hypothetical protein AB1449_00395 [Chloroflexota bacterium]
MSEQSQPTEAPSAAEAPRPSRVGRFFRRALRWTVGVVVLFALGVGVTWLMQVRPQATELARLRGELAAAQSELESLRPLPAQVEALQAELTTVRTALMIEEILVDVTSARFAIVLGDRSGARSELALTDGRLTSLAAMLEAAQAEQVQGLRNRLALALSEIDSDAFAAQSDLEVLANQLVSLRDSLTSD